MGPEKHFYHQAFMTKEQHRHQVTGSPKFECNTIFITTIHTEPPHNFLHECEDLEVQEWLFKYWHHLC